MVNLFGETVNGATVHPKRLPPPPLSLPPTKKDITGSFPSPRSEIEILSSPHLKSFSFNELKNATRHFRTDSLLGEGGFGFVYKGWLDKETLAAGRPGSGLVVAVKKLKPEGFQGHKEWLSEVNYLGQLRHPNLVKLVGFCLEGENRLLVYEYMPRGSLENHLFKRSSQPLSWAVRIKVAVDAARGLSFLHASESQVIYRDFKASNILLDSDFNAKLSDFGLAKAGPTGDMTHVSTQVMGTQGYAAPEYVSTGRRVIDKKRVGAEQKLLDWVKPQLHDKRKVFRIMDTKLEGQYPRRAAYLAASLALQCVHTEARFRPSMAEVLAILEKLPSSKFTAPPSPEERQIVSRPSPNTHTTHL
ncbi:hypothetical protein RJ640_000093 [Escallonia rubra]|uniref:non-specific serine/threonine protein kinase n=1 Tax=Escallonia rubra TaxID=112253 RepID=A0AA88R5A3_9ASTE|nr:hypothetical protein RJ640_000093 [Escallonia rubra]